MLPTKRAPDYSRAFSRLCHVAALTRTGKTAAAIDGLVASTWAIDAAACVSIDELTDAISSYFGLRLPTATLQASQDRLLAAGRLVSLEGMSGYSLATSEQTEFEERTQRAKDLRDSVRSSWLAEIADEPKLVGVPLDALWRCLETYTAAAFQRHGIHAIELLGADLTVEGDGSLQSFLMNAIANAGLTPHKDAVVSAVRRFFAETTPDKTRYLAGLLDATFTYFAIATDDITSKYLRESLQPLKVFVDTNVLFGVLDLSEDFFAGVARQLVSLVKAGQLPFTFYYHERTLREFSETIQAASSVVCQSRWTQELSRAAVRYGEASGAMRSAELAYHRQNALSRTPPEVFFSKYDHLERLLADQGLRIYRETPTDDPDATKTKALRIADYEDFVKSERPHRPRQYEALDHDVVVWQTVQRLGHAGGSPLEVGAVFLTNDYLFARFERRRLRDTRSTPSVVIAAQFVQVLRPFVPSTDDFDRGFVENLTLPEFQVAHRDYRVAQEQVLGYLATYSGLPEETALAVLSDEILRHQVTEAGPAAEMEQLIDSAIIRENARLHEANDSLELAIRDSRRTSAEAIHGLEERLKTLEARPADARPSELALDSVAEERDQALSDLAALHRNLRWALVAVAIAAWLVVVWLGPVVGQQAPVLGELALHARRLPIQLVASAAAPLALVAMADKERRLIWLGVLAVVDPLVIAVAAFL
jgi:hypothetical protein